MGQVLAAADIGSNTVHLLVAEATSYGLWRRANESEWLSLGEVVSKEGKIPNALAARLSGTLRKMRTIAESHGATQMYVFATEAMRIANNHDQVIDRILREVGVRVDIISPLQEAEFSLLGTSLDTDGAYPIVMIEVGGGSAQIAAYDGERVHREVSLKLGTGKLIAECGVTQPTKPEAIQRLTDKIEQEVAKVRDFPAPVRLVGSGGIARGLVRALHRDGERVIHVRELEFVHWAAQKLTVDVISERYEVKAKRAATLVPGSLVYLTLMQKFGLESILVSEYGVREGAVLKMARGEI